MTKVSHVVVKFCLDPFHAMLVAIAVKILLDVSVV